MQISPYHQILSVMMMVAVGLAILAFGLQVAELILVDTRDTRRKKSKAPTDQPRKQQSAR